VNPDILGTRALEYQDFLDKLRRRKRMTYQALATKIWGRLDPEQMQRAEKRLEHFFRDANEPRAGFARAVERALDPELVLEAEAYGFDREDI
jgi:hypothetical protein